MTPAVDAAKKRKLKFSVHHYSHDDNTDSYGEEAADKLGVEHQRVFKTLVVSSTDSVMAVALIPVSTQLNMKKMAKALGWKKVAMANKNDVIRVTGYVLGGVSPLGQKKPLKTVIDSSSQQFATIFVSAGKRGLEIELEPSDLATAVQAAFADISND